jgi:hypothetical protein
MQAAQAARSCARGDSCPLQPDIRTMVAVQVGLDPVDGARARAGAGAGGKESTLRARPI